MNLACLSLGNQGQGVSFSFPFASSFLPDRVTCSYQRGDSGIYLLGLRTDFGFSGVVCETFFFFSDGRLLVKFDVTG